MGPSLWPEFLPPLRGVASMSIWSSMSAGALECRVRGLASEKAPARPRVRWHLQERASTAAPRIEKARVIYEEKELSRAVEALHSLVQEGSYVDNHVFYRLLRRCIEDKNLVIGRQVHALSLASRYASNTFLANHVVRMYASHGRLEEAMEAFSKVPKPDNHMWASIISAYVEHNQPRQAITLYKRMRQKALVTPNTYVFVAALNACASAADLVFGKELHSDVSRCLAEQDLFVGSSLVSMYAKCGSLVDAREVFDRLSSRNVVTWTAMIAGYAVHGLGEEALALFDRMLLEGLTLADRVTFLCLLKACATSGNLQRGRDIHLQMLENGLEVDVVLGNCLVDMYVKCGSLLNARQVFDRLVRKDVVTWTSMTAGYVQFGLGHEALFLYGCLEQENVLRPDNLFFAYLLQACASVGALQQGKKLHSEILERGLETDDFVRSSLVEMYAKFGEMEEARKVLDRVPTTDVVTWTALLNGYAEHSCASMAMKCFEEMQEQGIQPNDVTFICLLVACSHEGLVKEGLLYFKMMEAYGIVPKLDHYNCLVDLYARSGHLDKAETVLLSMPVTNDVVGWTSLLSACKSHGDILRGRRCFDRLVTLEPETSTAYVLLSNIYANAGRWMEVDKIESLRMSAGARKKPAKACIEVQSKLHQFTVGEDLAEVSSKMKSMNLRVKKEGGHVPQTELVLNGVSATAKEDALCGHAEKLALAYGLMNTADGTTLLITKNLRMCNDCHNGTKILSRLERRKIVVRDTHRVHHFRDGSCSCGDRH